MRTGLRRVVWVPLLILPMAFAGCPTVTTGAFQLVNAAPGVLVTELYLVPSGGAGPGRNLLDAPLGLGGSITLPTLPPGYYDEEVVAIYLDDGGTERLRTPQIYIQAGRTYVDTIHYAPDDALIIAPGYTPYAP